MDNNKIKQQTSGIFKQQ